MKYLISLPENSIDHFHDLANVSKEQFYCTSDPGGKKVGSGGGTAWLLKEAWKNSNSEESFEVWIAKEKKILVHGGGQSRRLPSYATMGKLLLPIPVFRWERGQRLNQTLLDLQRPLFERIQEAAGDRKYSLVASGDVLIRSESTIAELPDADVICFGLSVEPVLAANHGVFITEYDTPEKLEYMLQKPDKEILQSLSGDKFFYIDIGIWLFSKRAINVLMKKSGWDDSIQDFTSSIPDFYDLYGTFGLALGDNPSEYDSDISSLTVAINQIPDGEFFHFGTSREIISSSLALQNIVKDPRHIWSKNIKPHPALFVQNTKINIHLTEEHGNLWIENSYIGENWQISGNQVITGVPENDWNIFLPDGVCVDILPSKSGYIARPYGIDDSFRGTLKDESVQWMNHPFVDWVSSHGILLDDIFDPDVDIYEASIFPIVKNVDELETVLKWMINSESADGLEIWISSERVSASSISFEVDFSIMKNQRTSLRNINWTQLAQNYSKSVFFQVDLDHASKEFAEYGLSIPESLMHIQDPLLKTHLGMFQARTLIREKEKSLRCKNEAFHILHDTILDTVLSKKAQPFKNVYDDQIVWSRSPVRIDLAGGWTDTPPYSVLSGGNVVNISLELNGQPPLQAFVRPHCDKSIILRSIDLGERKVVKSYADLEGYNTVGSPFSIPKAALCLAGFYPKFNDNTYEDLRSQLEDFGCGLEISFLAAIPKGSGMGTSSILASTILGALSDFCGLDWDQFEICNRTLALEQLLTTGGGWQDQYGGVIPGIKLLQTDRGWDQIPKIRWLPDRLFIEPEFHSSMLLYYTGITRVAKNLLEQIVEGMFLNEHDSLQVLKEMKIHAIDTWESIQQGNFNEFGNKIKRSWSLNKRLDSDTSNPQIESIISTIDDLCIGYKLPGAGGGGYLYIVAKDPNAANKIKQRLEANPPNPRARFVHLKISNKGLQVSRS